jgi:hypothetical protein
MAKLDKNIMKRRMLLLSTLMLGACYLSPPPVEYSPVQLSELALVDSQWQIKLKISNYGFEKPIDVEELAFKLDVEGGTLVEYRKAINLYIPALGVEPLSVEAQSATRFASQPLAYVLSGTVRTVQYGRSYDFEHRGTLAPVPGLENTWR